MKKITFKARFILPLILVSFVITTVNSCKKTIAEEPINTIGNKVSTAPDGIMAYYNFIIQKSDGVFAIKQYGSQATQSTNRSTQFGGFFLNSNGNALLGGPVKIGETILQPDPASNFMYGLKENAGRNLYGKTVPFSLTRFVNSSNVNSSSDGSVNDSLYVPQEVSLLKPLFGDTTPITSNSEIKWNTDPKNTKGVIILLEYDPEMPQNSNLKNNGYNQKIYRAFNIADSIGGYNFTTTDLSSLPNNSKIIMSIGRANYKTLQTTDLLLNYSVYAYTVVESLQTLRY